MSASSTAVVSYPKCFVLVGNKKGTRSTAQDGRSHSRDN